MLEETCDQIGPTVYVNGRNENFGHGRVNAQRAVEMAFAAPIANTRTHELHRFWCQWVRLMATGNKRYLLTVEEGLDTGYNGCAFCLRTVAGSTMSHLSQS